jgi:bifunctional N-acetylglutamate synthase/kinase
VFESTEAFEQATRLARRLEKGGVKVALLSTHEPDVVPRAIEATRAQTIPIVTFPLDAPSATLDRFAMLGALLSSLRTRKLIFLHRPGGLRQGGELVPLVNLTTDAAALAQSKELSRKERILVEESRKLVLERVPHPLSIAITSPFNLFRELFTIKGAGTLLRRGAIIERRDFASIDQARLRTLLAHSFGQPPVEEFFARPLSRVYLEESYRGAAMVTDTPLGAYLSKFAVDAEAQGEGLGRDLWQALAADHARVFWRARPNNPIDPWYVKLCDGLMRFPEWHVYWKGLPAEDVAAAIAYALQQPVDIRY